MRPVNQVLFVCKIYKKSRKDVYMPLPTDLNTHLPAVGLGLRREMLDEFCQFVPPEINFFEVAPENWMTLGGKFGRQFKQLIEQHPFLILF